MFRVIKRRLGSRARLLGVFLCMVLLWQFYTAFLSDRFQISTRDQSSFSDKISRSTVEVEFRHVTGPTAWLDGANQPFPVPASSRDNRTEAPFPQNMFEVIEMNKAAKIRNLDRFAVNLGKDGIVILVQVHNRLQEFSRLLESLRNVRYINECLLVFSHDVIQQDIVTMVSSIGFAPVLQLFFPYSIQLNPHSFPGQHPNDCPRNASRKEAMRMKCNNARHPDMYGHYREAVFTQIKHHWLWKIQYVLNEVHALKNFRGTFLRMDDDYYVLPDIVHVIRLANRLLPKNCPHCLMGILGEREQFTKEMFDSNADALRAYYWFADLGRGMAFNRSFWRHFQACARDFCMFDDYNWDFSLQHVSAECMTHALTVWRPRAGRVMHLGRCHGVHHTGGECDTSQVYEEVQDLLVTKAKYFFPKTLTLKRSLPVGGSPEDPNPNGGWGDIRDRSFCLSLFNKTPTTLQILQRISTGVIK